MLFRSPRYAGTAKVPIAFEKMRINDDKRDGITKGNVIFFRIRILDAPSICPISSSSELIDFNEAAISKYAYA